MTTTDRELLKQMQKGVALGIAGISDSDDAVEKCHEESFKFDVDADGDLAERAVYIGKKCVVKKVTFTPSSVLAADGTDFTTYTVQKRDGAGGAPVSVAAFNTNAAGDNVSLAAFVPKVMTITSTFANKVLDVGNLLSVKVVEDGTPTSPIGCFVITVEYI